MPSDAFQGALLAACLTVPACLVVAGCEGPAGQVSVLAADAAAQVPGPVYAWEPTPASGGGDPRIDNDIIRDRLQNAINAGLAAKGYRQVSGPASANFLIAYHVGVQSKTETQVNTWGGSPTVCGIRGCLWGMYGPPSVNVRNVDYTEGTLMLDVVNRASGKLTWRATSKKRVDGQDASQAGINAIVADMFKSMPNAASPAN